MSPALIRTVALVLAVGGLGLTVFADKKAKKKPAAKSDGAPMPKLKKPKPAPIIEEEKPSPIIEEEKTENDA